MQQTKCSCLQITVLKHSEKQWRGSQEVLVSATASQALSKSHGFIHNLGYAFLMITYLS